MRGIAIFVAILLTTGLAVGQCGSPGYAGMVPQLSLSSDLWDSTGVLRLGEGLPGGHWILAADLDPGPTQTPSGPICLGLSPTFTLVFESLSGNLPVLDAAGATSFLVGFAPGLTLLLGVPIHMQAVVFDPFAQAGLSISNGLTVQVRPPFVGVTSTNVPQRTLDVFNGFGLIDDPANALVSSLTNQGLDDFAFSPDGAIIYSRDILVTTPNRARAFDATTTPLTLLGDAVVSATGVGSARRGIVVDPDGANGYFCDNGGVRRFDADPSSPTFMTVTGFASTTLPGPDTLAISHDGQQLYVVAASMPPQLPSVMMVIDTASMTEIATVPLTISGTVLGISQRGPLVVSPKGDYVATVSLGFQLPLIGALTNAVLSIVDTRPGPTQFTEVAALTLPRAFQDDLAFDRSDWSGGRLYTVDSDQATGEVYLTTADWRTGSVSGMLVTTGSGGFIGEGGVDTTPDGHFIYVATSADDTLRVIDAASMAVLQTLPLASNGTPNRVRVERRPWPQ